MRIKYATSFKKFSFYLKRENIPFYEKEIFDFGVLDLNRNQLLSFSENLKEQFFFFEIDFDKHAINLIDYYFSHFLQISKKIQKIYEEKFDLKVGQVIADNDSYIRNRISSGNYFKCFTILKLHNLENCEDFKLFSTTIKDPLVKCHILETIISEKMEKQGIKLVGVENPQCFSLKYKIHPITFIWL